MNESLERRPRATPRRDAEDDRTSVKKYARSIDSSPRASSSSSSSCVETREDGGRARDISPRAGLSCVVVVGFFMRSLEFSMDVVLVYRVCVFDQCVFCVVVVGTYIACV